MFASTNDGSATVDGNGVVLTVHAPAGARFDLAIEITTASHDFSATNPFVVGPLTQPPSVIFLSDPTPLMDPVTGALPPGFVAMSDAFFDPVNPADLDVGVIPLGQGYRSLVSKFQLPVSPQNTPANFQASMFDLATNSWIVTNGQQRVTVSEPATLATSGYDAGAGVVPMLDPKDPPGQMRDNEQGDYDGDGDLDEAVVGVPADGWTFAELVRSANPPTRSQAVNRIPGALQTTTAEFADLNNDGYIDFIVGGEGGSLSGNFSFYLNQGAAPFISADDPGTVVFDPVLVEAGEGMDVQDLETGDFDGDGLLDVYAACAGSCSATQRNRIFFWRFDGQGNYVLCEETSSRFAFPVMDDTEDCEVFDLELDGDLDIYACNYDGLDSAPFGRSENVIHVNDGSGNFAPMVAPEPHLRSSDVLVVDLNGDGFDDVYQGGFLRTNEACDAFVAIEPDVVYINQLGVLAVADGSDLIPVNNWTTLDVEGVTLPLGELPIVTPPGSSAPVPVSARDYDGDGDVDVFLGLGLFGNNALGFAPPGVPGMTSGVIILQNQRSDLNSPPGVLPPFLLDFSPLMPNGESNPENGLEDVTDIELGDWFLDRAGTLVGRWFERDFGATTLNLGHRVFSKNE